MNQGVVSPANPGLVSNSIGGFGVGVVKAVGLTSMFFDEVRTVHLSPFHDNRPALMSDSRHRDIH